MKAYSKSLGRVVDIPDSRVSDYSGGEQESPLSGYSSSGIDLGNMRKMLLIAALSDPKNVSKYSTILNMSKPTTSEVKSQSTRDEGENKIANIDRALDLLQTSGIKTGPLSGLGLRAKVTLTGASADERDLYNLIGRLAAEEMFSIGGKVLPAQEVARIKPFIPEYSLPTETNVTNLQELKRRIMSLYNNQSQMDYSQEEELPTSWQPD